jgi:multidrug efflux pump subunit AcrB
MWLVNAALRHPYTVWVGMLLVTALGLLSYRRTPTDILPALKVPVVVVFASYRGMPAPDMEQTVTAILERALTRCDHLDHLESRSLLGISIISVYFRPNVSGDVASSQVIALVNGEMQNLPPGMLPPSVLNYDASAIPVGNLVISSRTRDDKFLLDLADYQLREELAGIEGLSAAPVFGGVFRQVQIYVQPRTLESLGMSPLDVARIVNNQSQVIPTGEIRIDRQNYYVRSNAMVSRPKDFEEIPLFNDGRKIVRLKDVAEVVDGTRWRTNTVRVDGRRAVYMPLLRQAGASAVRVVDNVNAFLEELRQRDSIPDDVDIEVAFDQSVYVRDALANLRYEAIVGAGLAALVVLLFLGSLRTTWIVALSIPLSLLAAFAGLYFTGETLNIMTLGGLALVLGRVVDDSVVDVENTVRHLGMGKTPFQAALDSASEISIPVLMATVTTVIVFLPMVFMTGMGKYLFTPLAVSVALALFASYIVSRTVSPLLCARYLRRGESEGHSSLATGQERFPLWLLLGALLLAGLGLTMWIVTEYFPIPVEDWTVRERNLLVYATQAVLVAGAAGGFLVAASVLFRFGGVFDRWFRRFTHFYERTLTWALRRRVLVLLLVLFLVPPAYLAYRTVGRELFPDVDSSEFTLHLRAAGGPRVEETERQVGQIENMIRGYQASAEELGRELARCKLLADDEHLEAIRAANPEHRELIDQMLGVARDKASLERLAAAHQGATFDIPGVIPPEDMNLALSNVGISSRWSAIYTPNNGPHAAFIRVQLRSGFAGRSTPTITYVNRLRDRLKRRYPTHDFFFETGGMIRRILNNGALAPIEVQIGGRDHEFRRHISRTLHREISQLASVHDAHSPQAIDLPQLRIVVDRAKASQPGLTESDVIRNVIVALMSSAQIAPNFWIDPSTGNPYFIGVQYPEYEVGGIRTLEEIPITSGRGPGTKYEVRSTNPDPLARPWSSASRTSPVVRLEDVATIERGMGPVEVYHYAANRVSQLFVSVSDKDMAGVAHDVETVVRTFPLRYALDRLPQDKKELRDDPGFCRQLDRYLRERDGTAARKLRKTIKQERGVDPEAIRLPRGVGLKVHGEIETMRNSFQEMAFSLTLAVLLVYLVMAAQFASWLDPLIMIVAAPLGLIGVAFTLWLTDTSLNIQSCMGVLMMVGISVSNSVLVVEFANRQRESGMGLRDAIITASCVRLRPILMTTIATLVALAPMAIHLHPGDEMNLPLARAVIGGLAGSTLLTLYVVPILYYMLKPRRGLMVTLEGHGPVPADAPPPEDPAATFVRSMPVSDWGEAAFAWPEGSAGPGGEGQGSKEGPRSEEGSGASPAPPPPHSPGQRTKEQGPEHGRSEP